MLRILFITIVLFSNHVFAEEIIEPVSEKKALIYLPFQSDFNSDVENIILALLPNFTVTVISNKDVIVNVAGRDRVFPAVNFDLQILENYILKLNEYDFIYFDSHANPGMISLGIPAPNVNLCSESSDYDIDCELFNNSVDRIYIDSKREDFYSTQRIDEVDYSVSYSIRPSFFTDNFTGENKFRNTIFVSDTCSNTEGDFPEVLTSDEVGISLFTGWEGTIYNEDIYRTTFPFLQKMMNGDTSKEAIKDIITDVEETITVTQLDQIFGLVYNYETTTYTKKVKFVLTQASNIPETHDVALYDARERIFTIGGLKLFVSLEVLPQQNMDLVMNLIATAKGKAIQSKNVKIYDGHSGEYPTESDFDQFKTELESKGFTFERSNEASINLDGSRAVFVLTPGKDQNNPFAQSEMTKMLSFVQSGGVLVFVSDTDIDYPNKETLTDLYSKFDIEVLSSDINSYTKANIESNTSSIFRPLENKPEIDFVNALDVSDETENHVLAYYLEGEMKRPVIIESFINTEYLKTKHLVTIGDVIVDTNSGLAWQNISANEVPVEYDNLSSVCNSSQLGGLSNWSTPSLDNLETILDVTNLPSIYSPFTYMMPGTYWSTTNSPNSICDNLSCSTYILTINFSLGYQVEAFAKYTVFSGEGSFTNSFCLRCVSPSGLDLL